MPPAPAARNVELVPPPPTRKETAAEPVPPAIVALTADRPHMWGEALVLVDDSRADEVAARLAGQYDLEVDTPERVSLLDAALLRLRLKPGQSLGTLLAELSADPDIDLVQPNYVYRASKQQQTLPQSGPQYAPSVIRLNEAHRLTRGRNIKIAVIDTAVEADHPELVGAIADVFDAIDEGPYKPEKHGTEIAGILGASAQLNGVAPDSKILSVRAFQGDLAGQVLSTSLHILKGVDWAFDSGAKVMNMSFAGPLDPLLEKIVTAAADRGVTFVAAAGNNGPSAPPAYPAAYPQVIAVTATDEKDKVYFQANRGDYIAIAAPGVDILTPVLRDGYGLASGTSMAAAHVSGIAALLLEQHSALSTADIRAILSSSARKPAGSSAKHTVGAGIVDALGAVEMSKDKLPKSDIPDESR